MQKVSVPTRIEIVESLRGIAALSVAWFHFTNGQALLQDGWLKSTGTYGWLGVEVFFVISGFIIPYSMHRGAYQFPGHWATFLVKRIVRLDPPYLVAAILALCLSYISAALPGFRGPQPELSIPQVLLHLGYLNTFFGYPWLIPVFWSLAIEFQFYICVAIAYPLISDVSANVRILTLSAICASAYFVPSPALVFHWSGLFALGIVTFWQFNGMISLRIYALFVVACTTATVASLGVPIAAVGFCTAIAIAFVRIPSFRVLTFLGSISYSLYLTHPLVGGRVVNFFKRYPDELGSSSAQVAILIAAIAMSIVAAYFMYKVVERPAQKWASTFNYSAARRS